LFLHTRTEDQKTNLGRTFDLRWGFTRQKENEEPHSKRQLPKKIVALTNSPGLGTGAQQTKKTRAQAIVTHTAREPKTKITSRKKTNSG
jgi:hypothetical protein